MGPEAEVPSAEAALLSSEALLSWEAELSEVVEALLSDAEPSEAALLVSLLPQPASMEAHRVSARMAERTFFMIMTFLLVFLLGMSFFLTYAYRIIGQCKVRQSMFVKSM